MLVQTLLKRRLSSDTLYATTENPRRVGICRYMRYMCRYMSVCSTGAWFIVNRARNRAWKKSIETVTVVENGAR